MIKITKKQNLPVTFLEKVVGLKNVPEGNLIATVAHHVENLGKEQALKEFHQVSDLRGFNVFYMGGLLSVVQDKGWWGDGYPSFPEFVERGLGMAKSTAYDYIGIYVHLVDSGVSWGQLEHLGWTKIRLFAKHLNQKKLEEWIKIAEFRNAADLREYMKAYRKAVQSSESKVLSPEEFSTHVENGNAQNAGGAGESSLVVEQKPALVTAESAGKTTSTRVFKLHADQEETVDHALKKSKEESDTKYDNVALEYICLQYLESHLGKPKEAQA